ncbi:MAG: hypothetical protein DRJ98_05540 [Thermoprotei archaeon]|nr:MAG: hypothetical protein DRJ98_05540 [Thermoprotei archaeon]
MGVSSTLTAIAIALMLSVSIAWLYLAIARYRAGRWPPTRVQAALTLVTAIFLFIALCNLIFGLRFIPPSLPVEEALPSDGGRGLLGFIPLLLLGFLATRLTAGRSTLDLLEEIAVALSLGMGLTSLTMIILGIFNLICTSYVTATFTLLLIGLAVTSALKRGEGRVIRVRVDGLRREVAAVVGLLSVFVALAAYQALAYPEVEWDSLAYGVYYAKLIYDNGGVPFIAGTSIGLEMSAAYPPGLQCLACFFYVTANASNDFYFRLLQPILGVATLIVTYKASLLLTGDKRCALLGLLVLAAAPIFWVFFVLGSYAMYLALNASLTIYFLLRAYYAGERAASYETLASLFAGFASLISYLGLSCVGLLILYGFYVKLNAKRFTKLVSLALVVASPWYLRNLFLLGNPVYPLLGVGVRIDEVLWRSTVQHFNSYRTLWHVMDLLGLLFQPYKWREYLGAALLLSMVIYPAVYMYSSRRQGFHLALYIYTLMVLSAIFFLHALFGRYLFIFTPFYAALLAYTFNQLRSGERVVKIAGALLIATVAVSFVYSVGHMSSLKNPADPVIDKWSYLKQSYGEADAWEWVCENVPREVKVATYEIRVYYLEREVFPLDGYEAAPLYRMESVEEGLSFLESRGVGYILSVPWASPLDVRMPPAYRWNVVMKWLGDPSKLPPVYVGSSGAAVYSLEGMSVEELAELYEARGFLPPLGGFSFNVTLVNATQPPMGVVYIPLPCDYAGRVLRVSVNSYGHNVSLEVFKGLVPSNASRWWERYVMVCRSPPLSEALGSFNPELEWEINDAGYFTLMVVSWDEQWIEPFNVTLTLDITS